MDNFADNLIDSNESSRALAFLSSKTVAPGARSALLPEILSASRNNPLKADRPEVQVARDALLALYDKNGGDEGLIAFAKWAIGPVHGFHGQLPSRVPLPTNVKKILLNVAEQANRDNTPSPKERPSSKEEMLSRRRFMKRVISGVAGAASFGGSAALSAKNSGDMVSVPPLAIGGAAFGVLLSHVGDGIHEAREEHEGPYTAHIKEVKNKAKAVVVTSEGRQWDLDSVALAASELLRNYVESGLSRSGRGR